MDNFIGLSLAWLFAFLAPSAFGQDAKLIEAAKKEGGKIVAYGSLEADTMDAIKEAFEKKTGLTMDYWRASATKVVDRAISEYRAKKPLFDVIVTHDATMRLMLKEGIFAKYRSPSAAGFPKQTIDSDLGPRYRDAIVDIVYNKSLIKPADAPKSLEDLLKPQYRGKLVMPDPSQDNTTAQWVASLFKIMGKEKADTFIRDLAATKPMLVEALLPAAEHTTTGERLIAITYIKFVVTFGQKGAPLDYVRPGKMLGEGSYLALSSKAPHPNAGKVFIDYFLDDESMNILAKRGEFVNRQGVGLAYPDPDKIQFVEMIHLDTKSFAEKKKEYQKIFLQ